MKKWFGREGGCEGGMYLWWGRSKKKGRGYMGGGEKKGKKKEKKLIK